MVSVKSALVFDIIPRTVIVIRHSSCSGRWSNGLGLPTFLISFPRPRARRVPATESMARDPWTTNLYFIAHLIYSFLHLFFSRSIFHTHSPICYVYRDFSGPRSHIKIYSYCARWRMRPSYLSGEIGVALKTFINARRLNRSFKISYL